MDRKIDFGAKGLKIFATILAIALLCALFWTQVVLSLKLLLGGLLIAFLMEPLCARFEKKLRRPVAVICAFAVVLLALALAMLLLIPPLVQQLSELIAIAPHAVQKSQELLSQLNVWLKQRDLPPFKLEMFDWQAMLSGITSAMGGTIVVATNVAGGTARFSLMLVLSLYFLNDWRRILLMLELIIPSQARSLVLRMAANIRREVWVYIRGQVVISAIVGLLAGIGLALIGAPYFVVLGLLVGLFNLIPYFGPLFGGVPAVLMALTRGIDTALLAVVILFGIQQLDGLVISPRIMSGLTGISPPAVLIAITVGGSLGGVGGMLAALPVLLMIKICYRVWVGRNESGAVPGNKTQ